MRRLAALGIVLASCTVVAAAQETPNTSDTPSAASGNWFTHLFSSGEKPDAKKADEKKKVEPAPVVESAAAVRSRESVILNRRLAAVLKLREIAVVGNDTGLLRKADELEERANAIYDQRIAALAARAEASTNQGLHAEPAHPRFGQKTPTTADVTRGDDR
jgi:hypothetical protein